jgi:hypothetical protein
MIRFTPRRSRDGGERVVVAVAGGEAFGERESRDRLACENAPVRCRMRPSESRNGRRTDACGHDPVSRALRSGGSATTVSAAPICI